MKCCRYALKGVMESAQMWTALQPSVLRSCTSNGCGMNCDSQSCAQLTTQAARMDCKGDECSQRCTGGQCPMSCVAGDCAQLCLGKGRGGQTCQSKDRCAQQCDEGGCNQGASARRVEQHCGKGGCNMTAKGTGASSMVSQVRTTLTLRSYARILDVR